MTRPPEPRPAAHDALPWAWIDGELVTAADAAVTVRDLGLLRGDGCFETALVRSGRVIALEDHLQRMATSLGALGLLSPADEGAPGALTHTLRSGVRSLLASTPGLHAHSEAALRITVTRMTRLIQLLELTPRQIARRRGLSLWTLSEPRHESLLHRHKTLGWTANAVLSRLHVCGGDDDFEGVWFTPGGLVLEGASTNLFFILDDALGTVVTPPLDRPILAGTARGRAIAALSSLDRPAVERDIHRDELSCVAAVFATSALLPVAPVLALDGRPFPSRAAELVEALRERLLAPPLQGPALTSGRAAPRG